MWDTGKTLTIYLLSKKKYTYLNPDKKKIYINNMFVMLAMLEGLFKFSANLSKKINIENFYKECTCQKYYIKFCRMKLLLRFII